MRTSLPVTTLLLLAACTPRGFDDSDLQGPASSDGCFEVDGGGRHDTLQTAIDAAPSGATISDTCGLRILEAASISGKSVTLIGKGAELSSWDAPINDAALTIGDGAEVTVQGFTINSTRSGIRAADATLVVRDTVFNDVGNYAISAENSALTVDGIDVLGADWGGIQSIGGDLTVQNSEFSLGKGFGISVSDGNTARIQTSTFSELTFAGDGTELDDGWGVRVLEASATIEDCVFDTNVPGDVYVRSGELTLARSTLTGSFAGIWLEASNGTISETSVLDYTQYGIIADGGEELKITQTVVSTLPELAAPQLTFNDLSGSYGVLALGPNVTIEDTTISGNNGGGIYHASQSAAPPALTLREVTVDNNARYGIASFGGKMTFTNVSVTNTRDDDATCFDDIGSIVCNIAVTPWTSSLDWTGGTLAGNGTYGLLPVLGGANVSGVRFHDNAGSAAWIYESAFTCDTCDFDAAHVAGVYLQNSSAVITNSTFTDGDATFQYNWMNGDGTTSGYHSYYVGQDILAYASALRVEGSTFARGNAGIDGASGCDIQVTNSTFDGYNREAIGGRSDCTVTVSETTISNTGASAAFCSSGNLILSDVLIQGVSQYKYRSDWFNDDVLTSTSEGEGLGDGVYASDCNLLLEDVVVEDVEGRAVYALDTDMELNDVHFEGIASDENVLDAALYLTASSRAMSLTMNAVTIRGVGNGSALRVDASSAYPNREATLTDLHIGDAETATSGVAQHAIEISNIDNLELDGFSIGHAGGDGLHLTNVAGSIEGASVGSDGLILASGRYGIYALNSTLGIEGVEVRGAVQTGIQLNEGSYDLTAVDSIESGTFGIECTGTVVFPTCDTVSVSGATLDNQGCSCPSAE